MTSETLERNLSASAMATPGSLAAGGPATINPEYPCEDRGADRRLSLKFCCSEEEKERIQRARREWARMWAISRRLGVSRLTLAAWMKKVLNPSPDCPDPSTRPGNRRAGDR